MAETELKFNFWFHIGDEIQKALSSFHNFRLAVDKKYREGYEMGLKHGAEIALKRRRSEAS